MAPSGDTKLGPSSGEFPIHTKHNVHLLKGSKSRYVLGSSSFTFRHLCMLITAFMIVMGLLSRSYLESPLKILKRPNFDRSAQHMRSKYHSVIDKLLKDGLVQSSASPKGMTFRESDIKVSEKEVKDLRKVPLEEQDHTKAVVEEHAQMRQDGGKETKAKDQSTTTLAKTVQVSPQKQDKQVEVLLKDQQQDGNLRKRGKGIQQVKPKEAEDRILADTVVQHTKSAIKSNSTSSTGTCDMTVGKWVHDSAGPLYSFEHCRLLSGAQNCRLNGRPDKGYEFYRWEPEQCSLARFDALAFLEFMRGKTLAFVGDSLARNQMESLMCILLQVAQAKSKGSKDVHKWYFPSHEFTIIRIWTSWLVRTKGDFPLLPLPSGVNRLNLTELDEYAEHLPKFDVTVLSSGHWWLRRTAFFQEGEMLGGIGWRWNHTFGEMKMNYTTAFEIALNTALEKIGSYPGYRGLTVLRTYTPDHYSGGSWDTGGSCTGETKPYEIAPRNDFNEMMRNKQLKAFKARAGIMPNGSKLRLLDIYPILNHRGDGHPGPYRNQDPTKRTSRDSKGRPPPQDCLHWCMPGPVDTMNELLFDLLKKEMQ